MNVTREQVALALFAKGASLANFKTTSRRLRFWSEVAPADQPALFMVKKNETPRQSRGLPAAWSLNFEFYIYCTVGNDKDEPTMKQLDELLDAFDTAFVPPAGATDHVETLGGICSHAWIEGDVEVFEGMLEGQAIAIVPINVLVP